MTRVIIAGGREFKDYNLLYQECSAILSRYDNSDITIISGTALGADTLGEKFANENNIELHRMPADWNKYGSVAGIIRNAEMAEYATSDDNTGIAVLIAFWDGNSRGTKNMIDIAISKRMEVHIIPYT